MCPGKIHDILKRENSTFGRFPECLFWKRGDFLETYEKEKNKYKGYEIRYIKGLATLRDYEYEEVISNESNWVHVTIDDPSAFRIMYSENVTERKKLMSA